MKYDKSKTTIGDNENKICAVELLKYHNDNVNAQTPKKLTFVRMKNQNFKFIFKGLIMGTFVMYV